jgi:signal recognition particle receptor subunit beta
MRAGAPESTASGRAEPGRCESVHEFKLVVAGPFASGKTTLITNISDHPVTGTEQPTTGDAASVKPTTTVGMEYGSFVLDDFDVRLDLYGVPGDARFSFMWDVAARGADGVVVLVDAHTPATWDDARTIVRHFRARHAGPTLVAVNRGAGRAVELAALRRLLGDDGRGLLPCDVADVVGARAVVAEALERVLAETVGAGAAMPPENRETINS